VRSPHGATGLTRPRISTRLLARLAIAGNLGIGVAYLPLFAVLVLTGRTRGADFTALYTGWRIVLEGHGSQLYDPTVQAEVQHRILGGQTFEAGLSVFVNPPHMVLPYTPLGLLPLDMAFLAWTGIQALLLAAIIAMLLRGVARHWTRVERFGLVAALVAFPPLAIAFSQGAFALVVVAGVVGTLVAMDDGRDARAGGLLALASVKPQGMFGMAIAGLLSRRPAALAGLVGWGLGLVVVATAVLGPAIWGSYLNFLGTYTSSFDRLSANPSVMWNLRGTLALLLGSESGAAVNGLSYLGLVLGVVAIAWLWRRGWPRRGDHGHADGDTALRVALTIVLTLLLSPHLNPHDDTLAAIAVALAYGALRGTTGGRMVAIGAMIAPGAILVVNGIAADAPTTLPIRLPTVLLVALGTVTAAALWRRRSQVPA
jgi:Glycosyltransferase family 87